MPRTKRRKPTGDFGGIEVIGQCKARVLVLTRVDVKAGAEVAEQLAEFARKVYLVLLFYAEFFKLLVGAGLPGREARLVCGQAELTRSPRPRAT